ncbi:ESAT-6 protein secretion system EspG family protein [Lentzea atacamensis]|uniref:ESAT-6 protein secretion system EspG family protein n=1 Tax=Lentzea atacamensis TaxID=531938 RepID=A0ABX9E9Q3_9PSEU|nr:ESX secretion-associated protein EspG [Lentzea atacamensis]RAS66877.1 ESAT-6 protein secretion system EspG family protein [Lentzea atacamensis]
MITPEYLLSPREFEVLWRTLRLGRMPYPLDVPSEGATEQEVRTLQHQTLARLRDRGLADDERLEDLLRLLDDHEVSVDAVLGLDRTVRALAASSGDRAVLAIIDGDRVGLTEIRPTGLAREIVRVLPEGEPGPGNAMSVRADTLQQAAALQEAEPEEESNDPWGAADDDLDDTRALQRAGLSAQDARQLGELASNRVAGGQFGVMHGRQRADAVINWFDTRQGRYLVVNSGGWLSLSPADNDRIATRIDTVLA